VLQSAFYPTNTYNAVEADVWALGIVLCHLFFGAHTPFWYAAYTVHGNAAGCACGIAVLLVFFKEAREKLLLVSE
jgi:hypothetical protein